ncbi:sensor histidine kinase [Gemmatimonadota bacterium]
MKRSFRRQLALRVAVTMTVGVGAVAALSFYVLRVSLDRELNVSIVNVASIQASSLTEDPTGIMRFHEWELTPEEAASIRDLNRYAQVWDGEGRSLLRTQYITEDLPLDTAALRRAAAGELVWTEGEFQGIPIRTLYYPLERLGELHPRHILQIAAPLETRDRMLLIAGILLLGIVATTGAGTFVGGWWLAKSAVQPVDRIIDQAEGIGRGSQSRQIEAYADTMEYHRLVQVLNEMLARLDSAIESQRRFTADASHELRSPLTALRGELEVSRRRERSPEEYARVIDSSLEEVERLSRISEDLLTLTRSEAGAVTLQPREISLAERARATANRLERQAGEKEIAVTVRGEAEASLDPDLMDRVIWNLLDNAIKFTPRGGQVSVEVRREEDAVVLEVTDTGPGIPDEQPTRIWERFFRADESRTHSDGSAGTGLGLAIVQAIVRLHGGEAFAENQPGGGALFLVRLPDHLDD